MGLFARSRGAWLLSVVAAGVFVPLASGQSYTFSLIARASVSGGSVFNLAPGVTINDATPDVNDGGIAAFRVTTNTVTLRREWWWGLRRAPALCTPLQQERS